jgi:predicted metal-dependent enzyme (double-stranded beta helix superfamily)
MLMHLSRSFEGLAELDAALAAREAGTIVRQIAGLPSVREVIDQEIGRRDAIGRSDEPRWQTLAEGDGCVLQLFVWPVGARTPIHDHTSWGVYACLLGQLGEERYARLDDESQAGMAHLRRDWRRIWQPAEQSTLLPYAGGIHRVRNAGLGAAASLHVYGPRLGAMDGRDYDPARDRVCDRPPELTLAA